MDTPQGKRAIASLKVGDRVLAEDPGTHKVEAEPVLRVIDDGVKPLLRLDLSDGSSLKVTANRPFYADASAVRTAAGWVQAGELKVGDRLRSERGADLTVAAIQAHAGSAHVYTLTVAYDHTFFVGDAVPVLVHNCDTPEAATSLTPASYDLQTIAGDPQLLRTWNNSLRATAGSSRPNGYTRYLDALGNGTTPSYDMIKRAWKAAQERFLPAARAAGYTFEEVHHWNFNRKYFPTQVFDPRNLVPVQTRDLHTQIHSETSGLTGIDIWQGPTAPQNQLDIPDWSNIWTPSGS